MELFFNVMLALGVVGAVVCPVATFVHNRQMDRERAERTAAGDAVAEERPEGVPAGRQPKKTSASA